MNDDSTVLIAGVIWLICAVGAYLIAAQKGRGDAGSLGLMGFLLGPIALVMAALSEAPRAGTTGRVCVHCGKVVAADRDRLCNHCGLAFAA
jgi:hypothetical protein